MKLHKWDDIKRKHFSKKQLATIKREVDREILEPQLRELRQMAGVTQTELAAKADMLQAEISRIEQREDHLVSTLRKYVEALGGELEVVAKIGDKSVRLAGV